MGVDAKDTAHLVIIRIGTITYNYLVRHTSTPSSSVGCTSLNFVIGAVGGVDEAETFRCVSFKAL